MDTTAARIELQKTADLLVFISQVVETVETKYGQIAKIAADNSELWFSPQAELLREIRLSPLQFSSPCWTGQGRLKT
jgi:hypothetical protein